MVQVLEIPVKRCWQAIIAAAPLRRAAAAVAKMADEEFDAFEGLEDDAEEQKQQEQQDDPHNGCDDTYGDLVQQQRDGDGDEQQQQPQHLAQQGSEGADAMLLGALDAEDDDDGDAGDASGDAGEDDAAALAASIAAAGGAEAYAHLNARQRRTLLRAAQRRGEQPAAALLPRPAQPRTGATARGGVDANGAPHINRTIVYVCNLHWWTTDETVEAAAAEYGQLISCRFLEDRASGKSKGVAVLEFAEHDAARRCKEELSGCAAVGCLAAMSGTCCLHRAALV